jgi:hypothetical protein
MEIPSVTKTCSVSHRELLSGEVIYSVLVDEDGLIRRVDFTEENWTTPPENGLGWWKTTIPDNAVKKQHGSSTNSLLELFDELSFQPDNADMRYILALLLLRRKIFRFEQEETDDQGNKKMYVASVADGTIYDVPVVMPGKERLTEIQTMLTTLTG